MGLHGTTLRPEDDMWLSSRTVSRVLKQENKSQTHQLIAALVKIDLCDTAMFAYRNDNKTKLPYHIIERPDGLCPFAGTLAHYIIFDMCSLAELINIPTDRDRLKDWHELVKP